VFIQHAMQPTLLSFSNLIFFSQRQSKGILYSINFGRLEKTEFMNRCLLFFLFVIITGSECLHAQTMMEEDSTHTHNYIFPRSDVYNTRNWEQTDCLSGAQIHLYDVLDSGYVIIHEYVMVNCRPCITAGKGLTNIVNSMKKMYPGRIKFFQTVYENETDCDTLQAWMQSHNFSPDALFIQGAEEVAFYGGMGMPTIVVLGGGMRHKGYYKKQGFAPRDNGFIIAAVKRAVQLSKSRFSDQ